MQRRNGYISLHRHNHQRMSDIVYFVLLYCRIGGLNVMTAVEN